MSDIPKLFVYGRQEQYRNYLGAISAAGGMLRFSLDIRETAGCGGLLLPGGGDLDPACYGQSNVSSGRPEALRDAVELALLTMTRSLHKRPNVPAAVSTAWSRSRVAAL